MRLDRLRPVLIVSAVVIALLATGGAAYWVFRQAPPPPAAEPIRTPVPAVDAPDEAARPASERVILVECRQGACQWGRIVGIEPVAAGADGELRRLTYRPGSSIDEGAEPAAGSLPAIDWEASTRSDYAYCSTRRPALAFPDGEGGLIVHHLDLFNLGGYQMASAKLYGLICHGLPMEAPSSQAFRQLGYQPGTRSEQTRAASPRNLLQS